MKQLLIFCMLLVVVRSVLILPETGWGMLCEGQYFNLTAPGIINIRKAFFGRIANDNYCRCNISDQCLNTNCQLNVTTQLGQMCNGRKSCYIVADTKTFGDPCRGTYKYLELELDINSYICENKTTELVCDRDYVIQVNKGIFGRRNTVSCPCANPSTCMKTDCSSDVTSKLASLCNGKHSCTLSPNVTTFGDPCVGTLKYLEYNMNCVPRT